MKLTHYTIVVLKSSLFELQDESIEENHPDFQNEVKEIWTSDIETKVKDFSTRVSVTNTPFIVYISGIDTYGSITTVSRSDVNMIVTVNPNTKKILLTSIPRDYYVTLANMKKRIS